MNNPKISVIMSVYNGEEYLCVAIDSILNQTYNNFEIIIIDDGSTDKTSEIISSYSDERIVMCENTTNLGHYPSLNRGLNIARGRFVAILDADDIASKDRLAKQLVFMLANPNLKVLGSWFIKIDENGTPYQYVRFPTSTKKLRCLIWLRNPFCHSTVMFDLDIVKKEGGYPTSMKYAQDYLLWLKLSQKYDIAILPEFLVGSRRASGRITYYRSNEQIKHTIKFRISEAIKQRNPLGFLVSGIHTSQLIIPKTLRNAFKRSFQRLMLNCHLRPRKQR